MAVRTSEFSTTDNQTALGLASTCLAQDPFIPSRRQIASVFHALRNGWWIRNCDNQPVILPAEVVHSILKHAMYLPRDRVSRALEVRGQCDMNVQYLLSKPVVPSRDCMFARLDCIEIVCVSRDQGWATGPGSWTWGELSAVAANGTAATTLNEEVYRNARADKRWQVHKAVWDSKTELVSSLHDGDVILSLQVRSLFPGWCNNVLFASITLQYI